MINKEIDILTPNIFPKDKIISGVTKTNKQVFPDTGLSLSPPGILSIGEYNKHLKFFADSIGIPLENIKFQKQVHSDEITFIGQNTPVYEADSLITNDEGLLILVKIADCAGVLLYDKKKEVVAAVHSGWRGTRLNITGRTICEMEEKYSSERKDILAYISPSASVENYEVSEEFLEYFPEKVFQKREGKLYFDNKMMIKEQLIMADISIDNIEISDICTISDTDYHSFRRDGKKSGRMAAFICIR